MSLDPKILDYIHHHRLTRDEEWTLELASELINKVFLKPVSILPFTEDDSKLDLEKLFKSLHSNQDLNDIIGDTWSISTLQVQDIKNCLKELKKPLIDEEIKLSDDDLFHQKFPYLEEDFLLPSTSIKIQKLKSKFLRDSLGLEKVLDFKQGKDLIKISSEGNFMMEIPTVEELADTEPIYDLEQVVNEKEIMASVSEPWLGSEDLPIDISSLLLEGSPFIEDLVPTCITPPLMPRKYERKAVDLINQPTEMARLVINSMQEMEMTDSQPDISNEIWDELDPFPSFSVTPPSSPPVRNKEISTKLSNEFLIPKENEQIFSHLKSDKPILETILFPRKHQNSDHRSNSFDPSLYLNLRPFKLLPSKNNKQGDTNTLGLLEVEDSDVHQVFEELNDFLEKFEGEGDYENERFEIPNTSTGSPPKRIKINAPRPETPPMRRSSITGIYRPTLQDFGLSKGEVPKVGGNQWFLPRGLTKVEGLESLNIDLSWTPYTLPGSSNVETLIDVEEAPQGCIAEISSSDSLDKDLPDTTTSTLFNQEKMIESSELVSKSREDCKLIELSSWSNRNQPIIKNTKVDSILYDELNSKSKSIIETYSIPEKEEESMITSKIQPTSRLISDDGRNVRFQEIEIDDSPSIMSLHMSEGIDNYDRSESIQSISPIPETYTTERHVTSLSNSVQNSIRQKEFDTNHYLDYYPSFLDHHSKPSVIVGLERSENTSSRTLLREKINHDYEDRMIDDNEMERIPAELFHERYSTEDILHDESTNQFETLSPSIVEENKILDNQNEERNLNDFSTRSPEEKNQTLQAPILREKLSERLTNFMKFRQVKNKNENSNFLEEVEIEKFKKEEEKTIKKNSKFNSTLPTSCPPPPLSIQDQLYLPNPLPTNELKTNEKFIGFYSIRISENRYLKLQLEKYFNLEESNVFDWDHKEKILEPDLIFQDQESELEIGIIFIRLSNLISGSYKPKELIQIDNENDQESIFAHNQNIRKVQEACFTSIYRLSKKYPRLLIILEAYPIKPTRSNDNELIAYAYTPPILKSLEILKLEVLKLEENIQENQGNFNADLSVSESYQRSCEISLQWVKEVLPSG